MASSAKSNQTGQNKQKAAAQTAREQAAKMRAEQARREKRFKIIAISLLTVAVLALGGAIVYLVMQTNKSLPEVGAVQAPTIAREDGGITLGASGEAGSTNEGAPEVAVYLDYMCPACGEFEEKNSADMDVMRAAKDITVVMHPVAILDRASLGEMYSTRAAAAAYWVAQNSPASFSAFSLSLFANQPDQNTKGLTNKEIEEFAVAAGVPADVASGIGDLTSYVTYGAWITEITEKTSARTELQSQSRFVTPTIAIDDVLWEGNWTVSGALAAAVGEANAKE